MVRVSLAFALTIALASSLPSRVHAEVTASGDYTPSDLNATPGSQLGGPTSADVIVGGTGATGEDTGQVQIDSTGAFVDDLFTPFTNLQSDNATIAEEAFSLGLVRITDLNTLWEINTLMTIGGGGQGFLEITAGGRLYRQTDGSPSADVDLILGRDEGSQGFALIDGFASSLVSTNVDVGQLGYGRIDITERGRVGTSETAQLGVDAIGEGYVLVQGQGSRWNVGDGDFPGVDTEANLIVGVDGRGGVEMLEQGVIRVENDVVFGQNATGYGEAYITGQGSQLWVLNNLTIGDLGYGDVYVNDRGLLRVGDDALSSSMTINSVSFLNMGGGTVRLNDGVGTIVNDGVIRGDGRIEASIDNGTIGEVRAAYSIANLREQLLITGDVTGGVLEAFGGEIEIQGTATPAEIRLEEGIIRVGGVLTATALTSITLTAEPSAIFADGGASLGGTLEVDFAPGFNPAITDTFELISGPISGTFATETVPTDWQVFYLPDSVLLANIAAPPIFAAADFDEDGDVDAVDLSLWEAGYGIGSGAVKGDGDANTDGAVTGIDFLTWQREQGFPAPATANAGAVPEPGAVALALTAVVGLALRRRVR